MNLSRIIYNIDSPYIFVDCNQQEVYGQLFYSIKTLREHSNIPVTVYSNSKFPLEEFEYMKKHKIKKFQNLEIVQYSPEIPQENIITYCIEQTFDNYDVESVLYISNKSLFNTDPIVLFEYTDKDYIYKGKESYSECNILLLNKSKYRKFVNGFGVDFRIIPEEVVGVNFSASDIDHNQIECSIPKDIILYQKNQTEYFIPSEFWNCSVSDRIREKPRIICHTCCRILENPIMPEFIVQV